MGYYQNKALLAKKLHDKGLPWVKVYAVVRLEDKFVVLTKIKDGKTEYMLAGGGVDEGESLISAIKREIKEELNMKVEVLGEIGVYDKLFVPWKYENEEFEVQYEIHVIDTKVLKQRNGKLGLKGEFDKGVNIALIDEETLLKEVTEFSIFKMNLDNKKRL